MAKDQLNQILTELAELHGLTKEEVEIKPLPKVISRNSLPKLKHRAKHLIDDGQLDDDIRGKKKNKKYKRNPPKYIRSARLQSSAMVEKRAKKRTYIDHGGFHVDCFTHIYLQHHVPRGLLCDLPPRTIGDLIYSSFAPFYKCEVCFSIRPFDHTSDGNPSNWWYMSDSMRKAERYSKIEKHYWKKRIKWLEQQDKKWV